MPVIRATNIDYFAGLTEGRDSLAEIVRRLVWTWLPNRILGIEFLSGEANNFPNWDGWVRLALPNGIEHRSLWEVSVRKDATDKIREDFAGSLTKELPPGFSRDQTTYVAVTGRLLQDRAALEQELRQRPDNLWAGVQIIDAKALEEWIEKCPPVEDWLTDKFGLGAGRFGVPLRRAWTRWSGVTQPEISTDLTLAGRRVESVATGLRFDPDRLLSVQADSPDEAVAIVYSLIQQLPPEKREPLLVNAVVVSTTKQAAAYAEQPRRDEAEPLTILVPPATIHAQALVKSGHKVVIASGRKGEAFNAIKVPRALRRDFEKALSQSMGVHEAQASTDARACGASVSIWRVWQLLRNAPLGDHVPEWAKAPANNQVVPAILARGWDEAVSGDAQILALLSAVEYEGYRDSIHSFTACDDPLHEFSGSIYNVVAPSVAYALVRDSVTPTHLSRLHDAIVKVFGTIEEDVANAFDLGNDADDDDDDMLIDSEGPQFSESLRDGLAETLLGIAFLPQPATGVLRKYGGGQAFANRLIAGIPGLRSDPRVWASLNEQLPLIAEATPDPFVDALESLLQGDHDLQALLAERGLFTRSFRVGLLWSLEVLAWSGDYLHRATGALLRLHELLSNEQSGDSPLRSLKEIYSAWNRGTSVPIEARLSILRELATRYPDGVWALLVKIHPRPGETSFGTQEPSWRDFGRSELSPLTRGERTMAYRGYAELALELAVGSLGRQIDLLEFFAEYGPEYRVQLMSLLTSSDSRDSATEWERLRDFIARNRSFPDAQWSVKAKDLDQLEAFAAQLAPKAPTTLHRWLFDNPWPELPRDANDFEGRDAELQRRRDEAIEEILKVEGELALCDFMLQTKYPHLVGSAVARVSRTRTASWLIGVISAWAKVGAPNALHAIRAASGLRREMDGGAWIDALLKEGTAMRWSATALVSCFLDFPPKSETFELVSSVGLEAERLYWGQCWLHEPSMDDKSREEAAAKLIEYGRASYLVELMSRRFARFGASRVVAAMTAMVEETLKKGTEVGQMQASHLGEALSWLRKQPDVARETIAKLEYPLIGVLTSPRSEDGTLVLHEQLAADAAFFVDVLCDLYCGNSEPKPEKISQHQRDRARAAWHLLRTWKMVPGMGADGIVDEAALFDWTKNAAGLAAEKGRREVALHKIGEVVFNAPPHPDTKAWPQQPVLKLIETYKSAALEDGFAMECVNNRGVTSRAPLDGGTLERISASEWLARREALSAKWPRSRALFRRISEDWQRQSHWHDQHAEQLRMRWS